MNEEQRKQFVELMDEEPVPCTPEHMEVKNFTDYEEFIAALGGHFESPHWGWLGGCVSDGGFQRVGFKHTDGKEVEIQFQPYE